MLFQSKHLHPGHFLCSCRSHLLHQDSRGNLCSLTSYTPVASNNVPQSLKVMYPKTNSFSHLLSLLSLLFQACSSFSHPDPTQFSQLSRLAASKSKSPSFSLSLVQKFTYYLYSYNKFSGLPASNLTSFQ